MKYCNDYAALLDLFIDGECTPEEEGRVRDHLASCAGCRAYVADAYAIRDAFPTVEDTAVPDGFADAVCAAVRADAAPRKVSRRWAKLAVSLAACAAVVAAAVQLAPLHMGGSTAASNSSSSAAGSAGGENSSGVQNYDSMIAPERKTAQSGAASSDAGTENQMMTADSVQPPAADGSADLAPNEGANLYIAQSQMSDQHYAAWISVSKSEIGILLDDYTGIQGFDAVSGETFTRYELSREDFDAIVAQLKNPPVTVDDHADTALCSITVYP